MRSLYLKILLWCLGVVLLAGAALIFVTPRLFGPPRPGANRRAESPMGRMNALQLEEAVSTYQRDGKAGLAKYIERRDQVFDVEHHLTDGAGIDLLSGRDFSSEIDEIEKRNEASGFRQFNRVRTSADGKFRWVVIGTNPLDPWSFIPYYVAILAGVVFLLWLLAFRLVSPLRQLADVMDRFGRGDLDARFSVSRRDEIGTLGKSFNQMADRIKTLLVAERRLLQDVSHELRSPLARLSFATRLARTAADRESANDRIKKEIDRLTELVSSLIEVTRAEGDPTERPGEVVDLDQLVGTVAAACKLDAQSKGCGVRYQSSGPLTITGNSELLRRAVENVVRNGIRYAPSGTDLEVTLTESNDEASVEVRDFGPGVPADKLDRLFDPFFRVEASRDSAEGGVGLGLAIARRAVSVHSGSLSAENANPGLRVKMRLPLLPLNRSNLEHSSAASALEIPSSR